MNKVKKALVYAGLILLAICVGRLSFGIWRLEHPNAPAWTFFTSNK